MASGGKRGAGDRVLESRHVIGLFMLMLLFSAVFFTLGYVMGRNQYDGQVRAATNLQNTPDAVVAGNPGPDSKHPGNTSPPPDVTPPSSDWEFYSAGKQKQTEDHLKAVPPPASSRVKPSSRSNINNNSDGRSSALAADSQYARVSSGTYTLQVSAVRRESDALDLARRLQKKKFPAFVLSPQGTKFYRVQVGPYADQKSAEAAKEGLEGAGFKAIVKRG